MSEDNRTGSSLLGREYSQETQGCRVSRPGVHLDGCLVLPWPERPPWGWVCLRAPAGPVFHLTSVAFGAVPSSFYLGVLIFTHLGKERGG